jgi:hypothetical protein
MGLNEELQPKRRLKDINVYEVSFVDKAANGQKFLVFKRDNANDIPVIAQEELEENQVESIRGGEDMDKDNEETSTSDMETVDVTKGETIEPTTTEENKKTLESINKNVYEALREQDVNPDIPQDMKAAEEKVEVEKKEKETLDAPDNLMGVAIKEDADRLAVIEKNQGDLEELITKLTAEINGIGETVNKLAEGQIAVKKGEDDVPTNDDKRSGANPGDYAKELKSTELRKKMTHAHAPNPGQWIREILDD